MKLSITMIVFAFSLVCGSYLVAQQGQGDEIKNPIDEIKKLKAENSRLLSLLERQQQDTNLAEDMVKNIVFRPEDYSTFHDLADSYN